MTKIRTSASAASGANNIASQASWATPTCISVHAPMNGISQDPDVRRANQPLEIAVGKIERARAEAQFAAIWKRPAPGPTQAEAARTTRLRALRLAREKADAAKAAADTAKPRRLPQALVHG